MRLNLPITNQEYPFPKGETLVSVTDLKGRILYCNEMFAHVSGFEMHELLGQPHNIIRHPEIPEEAFRDLWETIQEGRPWSAVVKNRRKDGAHYWVVANVTPLSDESGLTGYMSVRTEATREQIEGAEEVFEQMRQEKEEGRELTVFRNGRVLRLTPWARLTEALSIDLSARMFLCLSLLAAVVGGTAWWNVQATVSPAWTILVAIACVLALWVLLRRWIVAPVDELISRANRIAACDLTQVIVRDRKDRYGELQAALGQMSVNLMSIVRDARERSTRMCASMQHMSRDNGELAQRTQHQSADLQRTAVELDKVTDAVRKTAESARQGASVSAQAVVVTERSGASVDQLSRTMQSISEASGRIQEIIQVIESIAFQTNILALNAAVEAARAGEHGKGFAVVAAEVRALAQRTSGAAGEIAELITETTTLIGAGHKETESTLVVMKDAVSSIQKVNSMVTDIDQAAAEQLDGISRINTAIASLDEMTGANVSFAGRMAESTQEFEGLAESITETVRVFRIDASKREVQDAVALRRHARQRMALAVAQA